MRVSAAPPVQRGRLFLVPNLLGIVPAADVLPAHTIDVARRLRHFVAEHAKPARAFLKSLAPIAPLQEIGIVEAAEPPDASRCAELLAPARAGTDMGLLSDAGCPAIADPGSAIVRQAHREAIPVVPLVGPSSIVLALMASGMNGQRFVFHGYLPVKAQPRDDAIGRLESASQREGSAHVFIETPYRNVTLLEALRASLRPSTWLCVAADLTLPTQTVVSQPVRAWGRADPAAYARRPAIFVVQA
jgi:16S rRNA (cytidine1402-2'-O)-methyltransferase